MKTLPDSIFKMLLSKITTSFDNKIVTAQFDNRICCLEAEINFSTDKFTIELWEGESQVTFSESQQSSIINLMETCYDENIANWNEDNGAEIFDNLRCDAADNYRKEQSLNK